MYVKALLFISFIAGSACSSTDKVQQQQVRLEPKQDLLAMADSNFQDAAAQYKVMMERLPQDQFPKTYHEERDKLETSGSDWWCSGFYPGTLLYLYEETKDEALYEGALRMMQVLEKEQFNTSTHDLGFMMYCSFGNLNRLRPKPAYEQILLNSAKSLSTRFDPKVGCIRSWNSSPNDFIVIIDNMMNLELLFWATRTTGDSSFYNIAVTHANTTMENHFRPDFSTYHVINYNPATGAVQEKKTAQGYADESAWARGQAWGFYGYTLMFRETKDSIYLDQAREIADFMLNHPNLPEDKIPYWDFNAPDIPDALRDASAAAIIASALLELSTYVETEEASSYFSAAETILQHLSADTYKAAPGTNGGFILKHGVGHHPAGTEIDVPLTYADYYFIEALQRYKNYKRK
ncbi:glucuronyl hydrolase [Pontibacter sp. SGAir0037]|nr:glucuronyl hydrolase [Pontibacter sp. SGAir0037]